MIFTVSTVGEWITLITLIVGLVGAIAALVPTLIKLFKALKDIAQDKNWKKVLSVIYSAMKAAEETGKSGAEKKAIVLAAAYKACEELGVEITDEIKQKIDEAIESTIDIANAIGHKE